MTKVVIIREVVFSVIIDNAKLRTSKATFSTTIAQYERRQSFSFFLKKINDFFLYLPDVQYLHNNLFHKQWLINTQILSWITLDLHCPRSFYV